VAARNGKRVVILGGVSDLVGASTGEAYGKPEVFARGTEVAMKKLFAALPAWTQTIAAGGAGSSGLPALDNGNRSNRIAKPTSTRNPNK